MSKIQFSVIVVTRNRGERIRHALESIKSLAYSYEEFELIVVDNGSSDNTVAAASKTMAGCRVDWKLARESAKGICRARNAGLRRAAGRWVVYMDDDAIVPPDWLQAYHDAINAFPGAVVFGGPATLAASIERPWWWCRKFDWTMSCQDYGNASGAYPPGAHPYGLNMVIQRELLMEMGGFDTRLDEAISSFADETELFLRIIQQGRQLIYVPGARVIHDVGQDRFTWRRYMDRCTLVGRSHAYLDSHHGTQFARSLPRRMVSALVDFVRFRTPAVFFQELAAWGGYRSYLRDIRVLPLRQ